MKKVLIADASGTLGFEVLKLLSKRGIATRALIHRPENQAKIRAFADEVVVADASRIQQLDGICQNIDILFSALGKSTSLFTPEPYGDEDIDYICNRNLLHTALNEGVKRVIYLSTKTGHAPPNKMGRAQHRIQVLLEKSPLSYTVIRPAGLFSALHDLLIMGKRGFIPVPGSGSHRTNLIHPADLAQVVANQLVEGPRLLEVGGPQIHSGNEIAEMIRDKTGARIIHIPEILAKAGTAPLALFKKRLAAKLKYFRYVNTHDRIAPPYGKISLQEYLQQLDLNTLP